MIIIKKIKEQKLHNIIIIAASLNVIISPNSFMNFIPIKILAAIKFILTSIVIVATILLTKPILELIKKGNDKKEIRYLTCQHFFGQILIEHKFTMLL